MLRRTIIELLRSRSICFALRQCRFPSIATGQRGSSYDRRGVALRASMFSIEKSSRKRLFCCKTPFLCSRIKRRVALIREDVSFGVAFSALSSRGLLCCTSTRAREQAEGHASGRCRPRDGEHEETFLKNSRYMHSKGNTQCRRPSRASGIRTKTDIEYNGNIHAAPPT